MNGKKQRFWMCTLGGVLLNAVLVGSASDANAWATITVNTLADPGKAGVCALRDAIKAANTMTATNGCVAGKGHDKIQFSVTGTILLASTLPEVTDSNLTINGPAAPSITIDGGNGGSFFQGVEVMHVASGATLNINRLTIADGTGKTPSGDLVAGGILNFGLLKVSNAIFSGNIAIIGAAIENDQGGTLTVTNSSFVGNDAAARGEA